MPIMLHTPPPPPPGPYPGIDPESFDDVTAVLATMPPCSTSTWGTEAYFVVNGVLTVVRLCASGVAIVTKARHDPGRVPTPTRSRFTEWSAITGVGVNGTTGACDLLLSTNAETFCAAVADGDDPALPKLVASIFTAKGWT